MEAMQVIEKYFGPQLTARQRERFAALGGLYTEWNARVNVLSRKDVGELYVRHVLHSLAVGEVCRFDAGARVCDVGSGGGFPAVPLAILFPEARFTAVDSIGKKAAVIRAVASELELDNLEVVCDRIENVSASWDYVVCRAVTESRRLLDWVWGKIRPGRHGTLPDGLLCLKGGDLSDELARARKPYTLYPVSEFFSEEFFRNKYVVYFPKS